MDKFNHRKWFKKQYLEEGMSDEEIQAIRRFDQLTDDDKLKLAKIQAMMDRERSLREDGLNEASITMDAFNRMESMVDRETYKRFIDSLDNLLDDWYMEGFDKNDVVAYMEVIIPSN